MNLVGVGRSATGVVHTAAEGKLLRPACAVGASARKGPRRREAEFTLASGVVTCKRCLLMAWAVEARLQKATCGVCGALRPGCHWDGGEQ